MKKIRLSNFDLVTIAVARLGGETQSIHTEDVAIEAFNLAPTRFSWRKYPERVDLELVRRTLTSVVAKKPPLLVGSVRRGWMLSKNGIKWMEKNANKLPQLEGFRRGSISDALEVERMRLKDTIAWQKFTSGEEEKITLNDLYDFVRVNEYFSDAKRRERFNIVNSAVDADDKLTVLWQHLRAQFPNQFMEVQDE